MTSIEKPVGFRNCTKLCDCAGACLHNLHTLYNLHSTIQTVQETGNISNEYPAENQQPVDGGKRCEAASTKEENNRIRGPQTSQVYSLLNWLQGQWFARLEVSPGQASYEPGC
jgi:hypothetical protein